jgi:hypothetical protein
LNGSLEDSSSNGQVGGPMPIACTFDSLTLSLYGVAGGAGTNVITARLYKNGNPTSMALSLNNPGVALFATVTDSAAAHQFSVDIGDFVSIGYTQSNGAPVVRIGAATRCR